MSDWHFLVDRDDYRNTKTVEFEPAPLADGQIRVRIDAFGFTANNVTYAAAGDMIGYWAFFPAPDSGDDGTNWGRVPVWGFAEVVETRADPVHAGDRLFGYFPMSTELVMTPMQVTGASLTDGAEHRAALPRSTTATCGAGPTLATTRISRRSRCCTGHCSSRRS